MADLDRLRAALAAAAAGTSMQGARRICELGVAATRVTGASIAVMPSAHTRDVVYASDTPAVELEELQFELGEGPCVEAFASGRPVLIADLRATDGRWPMFAATATGQTPARAVFAFPLQTGAIKIGVLDLYRAEPGSLTPDELHAALLVADAALWSLLTWRAHPDPGRSGPDAGEAGEPGWPLVLQRDHTVVYQATGMVIAQAGVSPETALALLRGHAFAHDVSLEQIATEVVARRVRFGGEREDT